MEACGWAWRLLPLTLLLLWLLPGTKSQVCSVAPTFVTVDENELPTQPLATVTTPPGQTVVVSSSSVPEDIFQIVNNELKLTRAPDYETHPLLTAILECKQGSTSVTKLRVVVEVRNINDVAPVFPFSSKTWRVSEDTKVGTLVIPEAELRATDEDGDMLFYNLSIQSPPDKDKVFSLVGINFPALKLDQDLDYETNPTMVFHLLARDTKEPEAEPGHTATATVIIQVIPADMRPPWFLPCQFTDGRICINAQYEGAVSAALMETASLIFEPGPVYAIDGDTAINEQIGYSIIQGNTDDVFQIGPDSGNITMTKAAPHPKTFKLVVQARQVHTGKYSVTQVTIHVVAKQQYPPRFPKALYRGWLPPGTGTNVAVRDAEDPDRELRLRAEDDDFPAGVPNSGLQYRITNSSAFRMSGEVVRTNGNVGPPQVFYLEAEVLDKLTSEKDLTVIEILIQDTKPTPPGGSSGDQEQQVTMDQMAIVGGVLGALLFLTLLLLGVFLYKRNVGRKKVKLRTDLKDSGYDNKTFKAQESSNWVAYPEPEALPQTLQDDPPGGFGRSSALPIPAVREAEKGEAQGSGKTTPEESRRASREESGRISGEESRRTSREESRRPSREESGRTSREESRRTSREESGKTTPEESRRTSREESGKTTPEESRRTSREESRRTSQEESGKTTPEESRRTSREESGRTSREESRRTSQEESRRASREESGKTSREESRRTSREESRRTSQEESGRTTPEESRRTSREESGKTTPEESRRTSREESGRTSREESRRTSREESGKTTPEESRRTSQEERGRTSREGPMRSILTKERKSDDSGYKAVWFREDIGAHVDVVVINSPVPEEPSGAPGELQMPTEAEVHEELEIGSEEPELVLVVSEEPEKLLMASVEPQLFSVAPRKEPMEDADQSPEENKTEDGDMEAVPVPAED
ncbi:cadherin-related family member 5 isoform X4 [Macrotis lagotis]|uniref:cadherin-related family member 5 isoform X4 n=1 Tax=Macrotis lagotis TaxID=92651 RepID=UPI003D69CCD7